MAIDVTGMDAWRRQGALGDTGNCPPALAAISGGGLGLRQGHAPCLEVLQPSGATAELLHCPQAAAERGQGEQECPRGMHCQKAFQKGQK